MAQTRRMGVESSPRRAMFIDAAEQILREVGYVGISARQVAAAAGLKTQLLYYYFLTMDELILAVVRRINERRLEKFAEALASPAPLRALWQLNSDPSNATLSAELTSIANHRDAVRAEIVRSAQHFRSLLIKAATDLMAKHSNEDYPAAAIVMIAISVARTLVTESTLGLDDGHAEVRALVERTLEKFDEKPARKAGKT